MEKKFKRTIKLFCQFLKFGCFTFGGGWSIIAQMRSLYIEKEHRMTNEELLDITSVGRSLPGTMIGNVAFLYGFHEAGLLGAFACVMGMIIPPMAVLTMITYIYSFIQDNIYVARAMIGVRAAVVPIIAGAAVGLWKSAFKFKICYLYMLIAFVLYFVFDASCILLVVLGIIAGIITSELIERRVNS